MSKPRYRWAHQQERERWRPVVEAGDAYCAEPRCLMRTRWIAPGTKWHVSHDPTGTITIGVSHARCNTSEGASRGNRMRARRQIATPTPARLNRWTI